MGSSKHQVSKRYKRFLDSREGGHTERPAGSVGRE